MAGSFECQCQAGFLGNGFSCAKELINECDTGGHNCDQTSVHNIFINQVKLTLYQLVFELHVRFAMI